MPDQFDIEDDRFYEPACEGIRDPEETGIEIDDETSRKLKSLRDAILNLAPCDILNAPVELQSNSRMTRRILEYCDYHQRRSQDVQLERELRWRWTSSHHPEHETLARENVRELSLARRDLARDHYQAVVLEYAKRFAGSTISIVDATGLQEPEGMSAWTGHLLPFLKTNKELCENGLRIYRTLLAPKGFSLNVENRDLTSMFPYYGQYPGRKGMVGRVVSLDSKVSLASRVDELAHPQNLVHLQAQRVKQISRICNSLGMMGSFEDLPCFHSLLSQPSGGQSVIGMIDFTLNHSIFGSDFLIHMNQHFWTTRVVSSPTILGTLSRWTRAIASASTFDIGTLSESQAAS